MARFYLTTAIDYVNSRPHLGTAYEKIAADVIARYQRLCGVPTHFVMGNDKSRATPAMTDKAVAERIKPVGTVPATDSAMKKAGKSYEYHVFEGAGHGFLRGQDQTPANQKAAEEAWPKTIAFFRAKLGK